MGHMISDTSGSYFFINNLSLFRLSSTKPQNRHLLYSYYYFELNILTLKVNILSSQLNILSLQLNILSVQLHILILKVNILS